MNDKAQLEKLIRSHQACVLIETFEEKNAFNMVRDIARARQMPLGWWSAAGGVREGFPNEPVVIADATTAAAAVYYFRKPEWRQLVVMLDLLPHLSDEVVLRHFRATLEKFDETG